MTIVMSAVAIGAANAQEPQLPVPRAYDVCSVKPSSGNSNPAVRPLAGGGFSAIKMRTLSLVAMAFEVREVQVFGLPAWATDPYDVACRDTESAVAKEQYWPRVRAGVQALLADRFRLQFHRGARPLPVATLTVGKGGLKLAPSKSSTLHPGICGPWSPTYLEAEACSMAELAKMITSLTGEKVIDRTGVDGRYDFNLEWNLEDEPEPGEATIPGGLVDVPLLSAVLNEKLGLVIKRTIESAEAIFVDHIEKPGGN